MDDLGGALRQLAGQAVSPSPGDPAGLWRKGRARVRRRRVAAALTLAGIVVAGFAVTVRPEPKVVMPAGEVHAPAIPKNIYAPNRFLAGVSDEGPPGQLAVIGAVDSDDEDRYYGTWFGISATTGAYATLDLPGAATDTPMILSPDGRSIAYGITGPTRKDEFEPSQYDPDRHDLPEHPMGGLAVYDTVTGEVTRSMILTDYGIWTDEGLVMSWLSPASLVFGFYRLVSTNGGMPEGAYRWDFAAGSPVRMKGLEPEQAEMVPGPGESGFVSEASSGYRELDRSGLPTGRRIRDIGSGVGPFDVTLSGNRVVSTSTLGVNGGIRQVLTGVLDESGQPKYHTASDLVLPYFLGWLTDSSVLVAAEESETDSGSLRCAGSCGDERSLYAVDIVNNATKRLGSFDVAIDAGSVSVARTLLSEPLVHGRRPPTVVESMRHWILASALLLVAAGSWFYLRPKRRAWRAYHARERGDDA